MQPLTDLIISQMSLSSAVNMLPRFENSLIWFSCSFYKTYHGNSFPPIFIPNNYNLNSVLIFFTLLVFNLQLKVFRITSL